MRSSFRFLFSLLSLSILFWNVFYCFFNIPSFSRLFFFFCSSTFKLTSISEKWNGFHIVKLNVKQNCSQLNISCSVFPCFMFRVYATKPIDYICVSMYCTLYNEIQCSGKIRLSLDEKNSIKSFIFYYISYNAQNMAMKSLGGRSSFFTITVYPHQWKYCQYQILYHIKHGWNRFTTMFLFTK